MRRPQWVVVFGFSIVAIALQLALPRGDAPHDPQVLQEILLSGIFLRGTAFTVFSLSLVFVLRWTLKLPVRPERRLVLNMMSLVIAFLVGLSCVTLWYFGHQDQSWWTSGAAALLSIVVTWGGATLMIVQIWETAAVPETAQTDFPSIHALRDAESAWIQRRREQVGLPPAVGRDLVGLALSGGGIRSSTISLGFLRGLATAVGKDDLTVLNHVDYLSTVSGGGWAGGALTTRLQPGVTPPFDPRSRDSWQALACALRVRGDYLIPGGPGLSLNTLSPVVVLVWGAILNAVTFVSAIYAIITLLYNAGQADALAGAVAWAQGWWSRLPESVRELSIGLGCHDTTVRCKLAEALRVVDGLLAIAGVAALTLCLIGLFAFLIGVAAASARDGQAAVRLRELGGVLAARGALGFLAVSVVFLALCGSQILTVAALCLIVAVALVLTLRHLGRATLLAVVGAVAAGQSALLTLTGLRGFVASLTTFWADAMNWFLWQPISLIESYGWKNTGRLGLAAAFGVLYVIVGFVIGRNHTGSQGLWAARIRRAYLTVSSEELAGRGPAPCLATDDPSGWPLCSITNEAGGLTHGAPLHIMNAAVNTPGSDDPVLRHRGTARFEFSPLAVGGPATGWARTERYADTISFAQAAAISAAAVNSQGGLLVPHWARGLLTLVNVNLGVWIMNPRFGKEENDPRFRPRGHFWTSYQARELRGANYEKDTLVFVSDGGHHDNLGLTALVSRRCRLVVALDAGADPEWTCDDLAAAVRALRVDEGWSFAFDREEFERLRPHPSPANWQQRIPASAVLVGSFLPRPEDPDRTPVTLVYVKSALLPDLPLDVQRYAEAHPAFPQQTTADQFFDEAQFEAYHAVGEALARAVIRTLEQDERVLDVWHAIQRELRPEPAGETA